MIGLAFCAMHGAGAGDVLNLKLAASAVWGVLGAIAIGALLGWVTTHAVAWLRTRFAHALGLEGFFALGLIGLSFGAAQLAHTYGFLAVFAAGVSMRRVEYRASGGTSPRETIGTVDSDRCRSDRVRSRQGARVHDRSRCSASRSNWNVSPK